MFDIFKVFSFLKKKISKKDWLILFFITVLFFVTRLYNLTSHPIFSDEGIYIRWAKVAWHDASWRFISLTDGKQPLQTWGTIPFLKLFPDNALLAGRLFGVTSGFFALIGIFVLIYYLFGKKPAFFGSILYVFTPYFLFYDRMALVDSAVNAFFIWIFFFSILLIKTVRLDVALAFGLLTGMGLLAKSSVRIFLMLSMFAPILIINKNRKQFLNKVINFFILFLIVSLLSLALYNLQRLSPFFHYVALKNKTFVMTFDQFLKNPSEVFFYNITHIPFFVSSEMGFVLAITGFLGLLFLYKKDRKLFLYFLIWIVLPYLVISFLNKVLFPRYLIFFATLLLILSSYLLSHIAYKIPLFFLIFLSIFYFDYTLLFDFKNTPFPPVDRGQYVESWTAGWGMREIVESSREKSREKPVIILAEGNFGMAGDVLDVFLKRNDQITIKGYWPLDEKQLFENQKELDKNHVLAVFPHRKEYPDNWPIKLIKKFEKPGGKSEIYFFELQK